MKNTLYLGIDVSHRAAGVVALDAHGEVVHGVVRTHDGRPLETVDDLIAALPDDTYEIERALVTGVGSDLISRHLSCTEVGGAAAAVAAAAALHSSARTVIAFDAEAAFLASVPSGTGLDFAPTDVRQAGPCSIGIGWFLEQCAQSGSTREAHAGLEETVSCRCAQLARADIASLRAAGVDEGRLSAHAVRAAARILSGGLQGGGSIEGPVLVLGAAASTPGLAHALQVAMSLPAGSVVVPEAPERGLALGAARLAANLGKKPALTRAPDGGNETRTGSGNPGDAGDDVSAAASSGAQWVVDVTAADSHLFRVDPETHEILDAASASACRRALGQALRDTAAAMGLADARALGALACEARSGAWLRDRCPETLRMDAEARLVSGEERSAVARGVLDAVARGVRRGLTQKWSPAGAVILTGEFASVPGFSDALARSFGCEFLRSETGVVRTPAGVTIASDADGLGPDLLAEREDVLMRHTVLTARGTRLGTMALPLSLGMADNAPFWSRFLAEVGFDVRLLGREPSPEEIARATARTAGEPCSATVSLRGEVEALAGEKDVSAVFLPIEVDAAPLQDAGDGKQAPVVYRCPFLQAASYLAGSGLRIVRPILFRSFSEGMSERSMVASLSPWRIAPGAVQRALRLAAGAQTAFERAIERLGAKALESLGDEGRAVILLGRQYSSRVLSEGVRRRLLSGGVALISQDMLPLLPEDVAESTKEMYWNSGQRVLAAARVVARDARLGAVYLTHTRCGPDSFVKKYARAILSNKPWALMEMSGQHHVGDQEAHAALFRSCWDALHAAGRAPAPVATKSAGGEPPATNKPTVYFPDMGAASAAGVAALRGFDISAEAVRADESSLRAAACHTSGDECLPYIITIGNLAKTVDSEAFDPAKAAFFMASSSGSCRFGQYRRGFRQVLDSMGLQDVRVISLNQSEGHTRQMPGFAFARLLWQGMTALGAIDRAALHIRPRSADPRTVDGIIEASREDVLASLRERVKPRGALMRAAARLNAVALDGGAAPVKVAITGEIFVRSQPFTNANVVRVIEEAGGEAVVPPFQEWIYHVNKCVGLFARARGKTIGVWGLRAALAFLRRGEKKSERALRLVDPPPDQPPLEEIWHRAHTAGFIPWFGDASLALGRALSLRDRGARGVVNIVPYGCLPGTTSEAVFAQRRHVLEGLPVLHLHLDGGPEVDVRSKVRALVEAARSYTHRRAGAHRAHD